MEIFNRILNIDLPINQSAFLWGPRKTGKTTLLRAQFPQSIFIDFLQTDTFFEYSKSPFLLRALNHGLIPVHYQQHNYKRSLRSYVQDYLKEEIFNVEAFKTII